MVNTLVPDYLISDAIVISLLCYDKRLRTLTQKLFLVNTKLCKILRTANAAQRA